MKHTYCQNRLAQCQNWSARCQNWSAQCQSQAENPVKLTSNKTISCKKLKELVGFKGSKKTILLALHDSSMLIYMKLRGIPVLSPEHKINRFNFALVNCNWDIEWNNVIFSDEK
ncbi:hypothetical protein ENBRE01_3027 [Enteropsectra breve]|nr:hypothetical protein ENBRE01_3027 [Enteropsectra breve]